MNYLVTIAVIGRCLSVICRVFRCDVSVLYFGIIWKHAPAKNRSSFKKELVDMAPQEATVIRDSDTETIPVEESC
ncbi:hypothetical protein Len3610_12930 [Lentibacillus sp. CBA3610]|nr:hypothetical protein Len3610_12930 [Lentibacillus sp. CBA3610]